MHAVKIRTDPTLRPMPQNTSSSLPNSNNNMAHYFKGCKISNKTALLLCDNAVGKILIYFYFFNIIMNLNEV